MNSDLWRNIGFDFVADATAAESRKSVGALFSDQRRGSPKEPLFPPEARKAFLDAGWLDLADSSAEYPRRDDILLDISRLAGFHRIPLPIAGLAIARAAAGSSSVEIDLSQTTGACLDVGLGWRSGRRLYGIPSFSDAEAAVVVNAGMATMFTLDASSLAPPNDRSVVIAHVDWSDATAEWPLPSDVMEWLVRTVPVLIAADAVGAAEQGWGRAQGHVLSRSQFGRKLAQLQAVRFQLASGAASLVAARTLLEELCRQDGDGTFADPVRRNAAIDVALAHAEEAVIAATHVHGALGYTAGEEVGWCRMRVAAARCLLRRSSREIARLV